MSVTGGRLDPKAPDGALEVLVNVLPVSPGDPRADHENLSRVMGKDGGAQAQHRQAVAATQANWLLPYKLTCR